LAIANGHHGGDKQRHQFLRAARHGDDAGLRDGERPAGFHHFTARDDTIAGCGRDQIDLEFGGQHRRIERQQAERGITRRRIGDCAHRAGMDESMLLRDGGHRLQRNLDMTGLDLVEGRAQSRHQALLGKARSHAILAFSGPGIVGHG
jgi:hypothetical protein